MPVQPSFAFPPAPSSPSVAFLHRLDVVRARIDAACAAAGRPRTEVRLVAVSKGHPAEAIREAMTAGLDLFGESYAQELREKARVLGAGSDGTPTWHFIGPLQRNKVKYVTGVASLVHGVDGVDLARDLGRRSLPGVLPILVQVNVSGEASKHGVAVDAALDLCRACTTLPGIQLAGLMGIAAWHEDPECSRPAFRTLAELARLGRAEGLPLHELSMGMSDDLEVAISEGATLVRIGTALFGERPTR